MTIDQLGDDLYRVLAEVAPTGPVVLVGHSMGGMAVMALADRHPELFGPRVIGVALISTSTGRLSEVSLGLPAVTARLRAPVMPLVLRAMRSRAGLIERSRRVGSRPRLAADPALLVRLDRRVAGAGRLRGEIIAATPVDVVADFFPALTAHDKLGSLSPAGRPGDADRGRRQGPAHARWSTAAGWPQLLPHAELLVLDGAGHLAMMERPALVNLRLRAFLHRAYRAAATGSHRGVR